MVLCCFCCGEDDSPCCPRRRAPGGMTRTAAVLASATVPAREWKGVRTLALPLHECLPWRLGEKKCIHILGHVLENPYRWEVNLVNGGVGDDIALHINPRYDVGFVVRNSRMDGEWGEEEVCANPVMPFSPDEDFELVIFCTGRHFLLSANGRHLTRFAARSPVSEVSTLHVDGSLVLYGVTYSEGVEEYPLVPAPCLPSAARPQTGYLASNPVFPYKLTEPFQEGGEIRLSGRVKLLPYTFYINLQHGSQYYPDPEIVFHVNPRFQVRDDYDVVVANTWSGSWAEEVRSSEFPFRPGQHFVMRIVCREDGWETLVDDKSVIRLPHRLSKDKANALLVQGDVIIDSVHYEPNSADLIQL